MEDVDTTKALKAIGIGIAAYLAITHWVITLIALFVYVEIYDTDNNKEK